MNEIIKSKMNRAGVAALSTLGAGLLAVPVALAEGEQNAASATTTAMTNLATSVATEGQATITAVLPVLAPIVAAIIVIGIGLRTIRKVSGGR